MYQVWDQFKQISKFFPNNYQANKVLAHTFSKGFEYNARVLLNNVVGVQALEKTYDELFDLLD